MYKMHRPKAGIYRLYVKRKEGSGLLQVDAAYKTEIINTSKYLTTKYKGDHFVNIVKSHESTQPNINSIVTLKATFTEDLNQLNEKNNAKKDKIQHTKAKLGEVLKKNWKNKAMHGQYIRNTDKQLISEEDTFL
jgi:peptidoglycan hydrolase CwlO-like protein